MVSSGSSIELQSNAPNPNDSLSNALSPEDSIELESNAPTPKGATADVLETVFQEHWRRLQSILQIDTSFEEYVDVDKDLPVENLENDDQILASVKENNEVNCDKTLPINRWMKV